MSDTDRPELNQTGPRDNVDRGSDGTHRVDEALDQAMAAAHEDAGDPESSRGENPSFARRDGADPAADVEDEKDPHVDRQLDKGLKETFPASDPVSINPGAD